MDTNKIHLLGLTSDQFSELVRERIGKGAQHARLLYEEWFRTGLITGQHPAFNNAQTLFKGILDLIDVSCLPVLDKREDGYTGKFLLSTKDSLQIESVLIPMQAGGTLCVSSQVGCRMGCSFCETGRMGLLRSLTPAEIICQVFAARFQLQFPVRNVVFMGMGEPFDNYEHVMQAVRILTDPHGLSFGAQHITISTSGCIEGILRLKNEKEPRPNLAVSINAPNDEVRSKLMPINRKHDMAALYEAMKAFCQDTGKQILIAYVLIKGQNDELSYADELAHYLTGLDVKINLIPFNPQSRDRYQAPDKEIIEAFMQRLRSHGYQTLLRQTKGQKIMAACGQLGNLKLRNKKFSLCSAPDSVI